MKELQLKVFKDSKALQSFRKRKRKTVANKNRVRYSTKYGLYYHAVPTKVREAVVLNKESVIAYTEDKHEKVFSKLDGTEGRSKDHFDSSFSTSHFSTFDVAYIEDVDNEKESVEVPPGIYRLFFHDNFHGLAFSPLNIQDTDKYIPLDNPVNTLSDDIEDFFSSREKYEKLNLRYRRASLVYGPPGNGKTLEVIKIAKKYTEKGVRIFIVGTDMMEDLFELKNTDVFETAPVIFIIEEFTEVINGRRVSEVLGFLDGEYSWNNSYTIGTTNYPEKIPGNIIDRPGRFDTLLHVPHPDPKTRERYLKELMEGDVPDGLVGMLDGYSIAYIREVVLRSKLKNISVQNAFRQLQEARAKVKSSFAEPSGQYL